MTGLTQKEVVRRDGTGKITLKSKLSPYVANHEGTRHIARC